MSNVTTISIVETLQKEIENVQKDKSLDIEKRIKLITSLTNGQLRAGGLHVAFMKVSTKLPQEVQVLQLSSPDTLAASATKQ